MTPLRSRIGRVARRALPFAIVSLTLTGFLAPAVSGLSPRWTPEKPEASRLWPGLRTDLIVVKFTEDAEVRLRSGTLTSTSSLDLSDANEILVDRSGLTLNRLFTRSESELHADRLEAEANSGREMADLNNYYRVDIASPTVASTESLLDELNALDEVEIAYAEPIPEMALLNGNDRRVVTRSGERVERPVDARASGAPTPDFTAMQGYLNAAPSGVDAWTAWTYPGGAGETIKVIDIELGWNWDHEDLPDPFYREGPEAYGDHGTAVVGEFASMDNGFGTTGISHQVQVGSHNVLGTPSADVFDQVAAALDPGDIFVIELHCPGPGASGSGQHGYIALEYWQANFDAIAMATARGIFCCQAAGNGEQDFDHPMYDGRFDPAVRHSGSIIVGATDGSSLGAAWFTNYGQRVDLSGWGFNVASTGYGDLQGGPQDQWYTAGFSGTSSATPIVTGAVAALQGAYKAHTGGTPLPPGTLAQVLKETGTTTDLVQHIGPRPNLALAIPMALGQLGSLTGTITDLDTGDPLEGAEIYIDETAARTYSAADGTYSLPVTAGDWTVRTTLFGYHTDVTSVDVLVGETETHAVLLDRQSTGTLSGTATSTTGEILAGIAISIPGTPLAGATSAGDGTYAIDEVPFGYAGLLQAASPDHAPELRPFTQFGAATVVDPVLAATDGFESSDGGWIPDDDWEWGTPSYSLGPASAYAGSRCWGTDLSGAYAAVSNHRLVSPSIDLTGITSPRLVFWHWYAIWGPFDGANVQISTNGGSTWSTLEPVGAYPDPCVYVLASGGCQPGYTNSSAGWVPESFDLSAYAGETVKIRFNLETFRYSDSPGWYVDNLAVAGSGVTVSVELTPEMPVGFLGAPSPSPTRAASRVSFALAAEADASLRVYDTAGRLVRTLTEGRLAAGAHEITWDGRDAQGSRSAPGVYFLRLDTRSGDAAAATWNQKLVIVR